MEYEFFQITPSSAQQFIEDSLLLILSGKYTLSHINEVGLSYNLLFSDFFNHDIPLFLNFLNINEY